jgi:hypothetical protein
MPISNVELRWLVEQLGERLGMLVAHDVLEMRAQRLNRSSARCLPGSL